MKLVREHIEQFTRGGNTFKTLNIGKRAVIKNWFETWAPNNDYEIDDDLNIHVKGSLWLKDYLVTYLPDNLHIERYLDLTRTKITLPNNLHVDGNLYIKGTKITSLPDDLYVGKEIFKDF